ncbi:hypothetical protein [Nocardia aurantia]|uniref:Virginiamycin B lyase n=1 Tax=Nocardia aurantia TaxID=2585199 RepID=A0A7K0DJV0_9NOCA|nr:hypothetical protein [Nocardia aurantia]MQY25989.1 Virginiamycin B lyase [Nocardia aurantia]
MPLRRLKVSELGNKSKIAGGGQGVVFTAPGVRMQYANRLVYKEYRPANRVDVDVRALESMPAHLESLPFGAGAELLSIVAWPCRLVTDDSTGEVLGFVMPAIPDPFFVDMTKASGRVRVTGEFQHLLNDDSFLARRGIALTDRNRYELLTRTAEALSILHRHGIAVGDLSPKNLLFSLTPTRAVYFIDCDAMRLHNRSVLPQLETPGWEVHTTNPTEELATPASDNHKLGLLALRLLTGDQTTRDPTRLPPTVAHRIRQLIHAALDPDPTTRPTATDWIPDLTTATTTANTTPPPQPPPTLTRPIVTTHPGPTVNPPPPQPLPPPPPNTPRRQPVSGRVKAVAAGAAVFAVVVAWAVHSTGGGNGSGGDRTGKPTAAQVISGNSPLRVTGVDTVGHSPWGVGVDADTRTAFVTNADDNTITTIDLDTGATGTLPAAAKPTAVAVDQAGHLAYVTNALARSVSVIDTRTVQFTATVQVGAGPYGIALDRTGRTAYVSNFDEDSVSVIDTRRRVVTATVRVGGHPYGIAVDQSTGNVYVATARDNAVTVVDGAGSSIVAVVPVGEEPWGVAVESGTAYVTNHRSGTVSVIDTSRRAVVGTITVGNGPVGVAFAPGGRTEYVTDHGVDTVSVIDAAARRVTDTVRVGNNPHGICFDRTTGAAYITDFTVGTVSIVGR